MALDLTYLDFLAGAVCVPLAVLAGSLVRRPPTRDRRSVLLGTALLAGVALCYTTPWDNYLIALGAWTYGEGRVAARLWHAPVAEYLFILGQTALVGLWTAHRIGPVHRGVSQSRRDIVLGAAAGTTVGLVGLALLDGRTVYLGAILGWAGPVLALQWAVGWRYLWAVRRWLAVTVLLPAVYLSAADLLAIADGIWALSPRHTIGLALWGLPVEEAVFFLVTTLFVVQGLVLLPWVIDRWT